MLQSLGSRMSGFSAIKLLVKVLKNMQGRLRVDVFRKTIAECEACLQSVDLSYLNTICFNECSLQTYPRGLEFCSSLTVLSLNESKLSSLDELCCLVSLKELYMHGNKVSKIPSCISKLSNLTALDLSEGEILRVPSFLCELKNLRVLYMYKNKIESISARIVQLDQLETLYLFQNPMPREFRVSSYGKKKVALLSAEIAKYFHPQERQRSSCLCLLWIRKNHKDCGLLGLLPYDIVKIIAKFML